MSPKICYRLHLNLIDHGREVCVAGVPRCGVCPLTDVCEYYRKSILGRTHKP
jgi:endonuclease III